ncbi:DUF1003 domain-containing protein [Nakamurella antarctica]|uniref:DUF1003 domain-containing protein n=1 Tax=Nakamurella antarctica TaxID=1902245 RepID=A0A3G8ZV52_9ACTN|nr:DUF1003 domain-containing protein [Nakamurella antarctica]AZI58354.1 DUF1003 domain-containing protein [Nakamurella antarctica]
MADSFSQRHLDQPKSGSRFTFKIDPDSFGKLSERLARFLGTGKFLFWQTLFVIMWILVNILAASNSWDPYPFILLNLAFSTQAAYAAPLILLAQNRQDDRDRISLEEDRSRAVQTKAGTEYLAREIAALRVAINEVATRDYIRGEVDKLRQDLDALAGQLSGAEPADGTGVPSGQGNRKREKPKVKAKVVLPTPTEVS